VIWQDKPRQLSLGLSCGGLFTTLKRDEETHAPNRAVFRGGSVAGRRGLLVRGKVRVEWAVPGGASSLRHNMARIRKLLHTRYRVNDLEKTVAFYREVLGLQETGRYKSPRGSELVFMKAPDSDEEIELCSYPASGPVKVPPDLTHLAFEVEDIEAFARQLEKKGVKLSDGPTKTPEIIFAFLDAPEGYEIELIQRIN
jgi:lactoylglutathione lyase